MAETKNYERPFEKLYVFYLESDRLNPTYGPNMYYPIATDDQGMNILGHYGNPGYGIERLIEERALSLNTKVFCRVPPQYPDFVVPRPAINADCQDLFIQSARNLQEWEIKLVRESLKKLNIYEKI